MCICLTLYKLASQMSLSKVFTLQVVNPQKTLSTIVCTGATCWTRHHYRATTSTSRTTTTPPMKRCAMSIQSSTTTLITTSSRPHQPPAHPPSRNRRSPTIRGTPRPYSSSKSVSNRITTGMAVIIRMCKVWSIISCLTCLKGTGERRRRYWYHRLRLQRINALSLISLHTLQRSSKRGGTSSSL